MARKSFEEWEDDAIESVPYLASDEHAATLRDAGQIMILEKNQNSHIAVKPWIHFVAGGIGGMADRKSVV